MALFLQSSVVGTLIVLDHRENVDKRNKENIEEVNESFISMMSNLDI